MLTRVRQENWNSSHAAGHAEVLGTARSPPHRLRSPLQLPPLGGSVPFNSRSQKGFSVLTLEAFRKILAIVLQKLCGVNPSGKNALQSLLSHTPNPLQDSQTQCGTKTRRTQAIARRPKAGPDEGSICKQTRQKEILRKSKKKQSQRFQRPGSTRAEDMLLLPASPNELGRTIAQFPCSIAAGSGCFASTLRRGNVVRPTLTVLSDRMKVAKGSCRKSVKTPSGSTPLENALTSFDLSQKLWFPC